MDSSMIEALAEYGPTLVQVALLAACAWNLWQRNIGKSLISLAACVATFILGW